MRLFHFSEDPGIEVFVPRPVGTPAARPGGSEWLNGPLVWAIAEPRAYLYLFPRDCPRILLWATDRTSATDRLKWIGETQARAVAYVENGWLPRLQAASIHRYTLPPDTFEDIGDAGMWVSRSSVTPLAMETLSNLPAHLAALGVELRTLNDLSPLRNVWRSSIHASGIRLRHAKSWLAPG
ncbi:MAG: hypothetical protein QM698_14400 [Micropepsaceae bacterium]